MGLKLTFLLSSIHPARVIVLYCEWFLGDLREFLSWRGCLLVFSVECFVSTLTGAELTSFGYWEECLAVVALAKDGDYGCFHVVKVGILRH